MRRVIALVACAAALTARATTIDWMQILPSNPVAGEDFVVEIDLASGFGPLVVTGVEAVSAGQTVTLNVMYTEGTTQGASSVRARTVLNKSAGNYLLFAQVVTPTFVFTRPLNITVAPATAVSPQFRNVTGLWWNPAEPGSALNVTQSDSGQLFALWYTYYPTTAAPPTGSNMWLNMSAGRWTTPTEFRGLLYWAVGTPVDLAFDASRGRLVPAGLMTIRVVSADQLTFEVDTSLGTGLARTQKQTTLQRYKF
jgi:hypothetical protein